MAGANQYGPYGTGGKKEIKLNKNQSTNFDFPARRVFGPKAGYKEVLSVKSKKAIGQITKAATAKGYRVSVGDMGVNARFKKTVLVHTFKGKSWG